MPRAGRPATAAANSDHPYSAALRRSLSEPTCVNYVHRELFFSVADCSGQIRVTGRRRVDGRVEAGPAANGLKRVGFPPR